MAEHYDCAVLPARPYRPRDKAKVEAGVLIAQRWILAVLRHRTFYSLLELNTAIRECLDRLNTRLLRRVKKARRELFEALDRLNALPLPRDPTNRPMVQGQSKIFGFGPGVSKKNTRNGHGAN